jgi:hypothetical protein
VGVIGLVGLGCVVGCLVIWWVLKCVCVGF